MFSRLDMSRDYKKILILRFGAIGDVVHTSGLFRSIKTLLPDSQIHYVTFKTPSLLIENDPDLEKEWILEGKTYKHLINLAKELKKEKFDIFINLQPSIKTKVFSWFLRAKNTLVYKKTFKLHAVENFWKTARPLLKDLILPEEIKIYLNDDDREAVNDLISTEKKLIGLNIGANQQRQGRKYPLAHWKILAQKLAERQNFQIVLTGGKEDEKDAEELVSCCENIISFCGKLSIRESAALLERCDLVISGDTGPLHIATAVGTKVIGLYGSMPINRTGPYGKDHISLKSDIMKCVPCNRRKCKFLKKGEEFTPCMFDISPEKVLSFIEI
jgi:ADP-heptose:LPS heptosyltransferase